MPNEARGEKREKKQKIHFMKWIVLTNQHPLLE